MSSDQQKTTDNIRDPVLRKMAEDFNKQSLTIAAYHLLHIRQSMMDQALAAMQEQKGPPLIEPPKGRQAVAKLFLDGCVQAGKWVVREVLAQAGKNECEQPLPNENKVIILDALDTDVRRKKAKPTRKTEVQDGTDDTLHREGT